MAMLTRRDLARRSAVALASLFARPRTLNSAAPGSLSLSLVHEFHDTRLLDVAADGTKLCLDDWKIPGYPVRAVETNTFRTIYSGNFHVRALSVGFFADGQALFLNFAGAAHEFVHRQTVVDVSTGERTDRMPTFNPFQYFDSTHPSIDRTLLVMHYEHKPRHTLTWLSRVEFPSYRELVRVHLPAELTDARAGTGVAFSDDRQFMLYFFGNALVCRRTVDLGVVWTRPFEPDIRALPSGISAHGELVAATIVRGTIDGPFERYTQLHVCVYDGKTGAEVARLPLTSRVSLSADGRLLTDAAREPGKKGEVLATVQIYEASSGARVASVLHDRIPKGRHQWGLSLCGARFTSDGNYMITSGMTTKMWRVEG